MLDLSAATILRTFDPAALVSDDPTHTFRRLLLVWHPDHNRDPQAQAVTDHLLKLREAARKGAKLADPNAEPITIPGGALRFEAAEIHMDAPGCDVAATILSGLHLVHPDLSRRLPTVVRSGDAFLSLARPPDSVSLATVQRAYPAGVPQEHVAWMASRLYELVMVASERGRVLCGGLLPESMLVLVDAHGVIPLDWRFTVPLGTRLTQIPGALAGFVPSDKRATSSIDLLSVNRLAIILLGDPSGIGNALLTRAKTTPAALRPAFLDWFRSPPKPDPIANYHAYRSTLETIFGKPKYHKLEL